MTENDTTQSRRTVLKRTAAALAVGAVGATGVASADTDDEPDVAVSSEPQNVTTTSAELGGWIDDLGGAERIDVYFEYGEKGEGLTRTSDVKTFYGRPGLYGFFEIEVSDFDPATTYEYRVVGEASDGKVERSRTAEFTTKS